MDHDKEYDIYDVCRGGGRVQISMWRTLHVCARADVRGTSGIHEFGRPIDPVMTSTYLLIAPMILMIRSQSIGGAHPAFPDSCTGKDPFLIEGWGGTRSQYHINGTMSIDHLAELRAIKFAFILKTSLAKRVRDCVDYLRRKSECDCRCSHF
jgi:hypothetical protein